MRQIRCLFSSISLLFLIGTVNYINAANFIVTNTNDSGAGSLRDAITQANSNGQVDTITFDATVFNTPQTINLTSGELFIDRDGGNLLMINGPGSNLLMISAGNQSRVIFLKESINVSINGLTLKDGNATGTSEPGANLLGGALIIRNATNASFNDIIVSDSIARLGGGIYGVGENITITNSQILRNSIQPQGGFSSGGGIDFPSTITNLKIHNTVIKDNTAETNVAGADLNATNLDLSGLTIENNTVPNGTNGRTGGLRMSGGGKMVNSVIRNNKGTFSGGGIEVIPLPAFPSPHDGILFKGITVENNVASSEGGGLGCGVFRNGGFGDLVIIDSTISNNTCVDETPETPSGDPGGGLYSAGADFTYLINSTVVNNSTVDNTSTQQARGGGVFNANNMYIINSTITGNSAGYRGGGVAHKLQAGVTITIVQNSIIAGNTSGDEGQDVSGDSFTSNGFNIIGNATGSNGFGVTGDMLGADPLLDPNGLQNNGGQTLTIMPMQGSPAINNGSNALAVNEDENPLRFDQRGACFNRFIGTVDIGAFEVGATQLSGSNAPFDFDGDCKTDIGIFRPNVGEWWYLRSSDLDNRALQFGQSTDVPVPADFTGDGKTDIAFFRNGEWFVLRSEDDSFFSFPWGSSGDIPAPGDYDGDGRADPAVFRPNDTNWFILKSTGGVDIIPFGIAEDKPVVADYDGDGKDDIAIFRPSVSEWWINQSQDGVSALQFGSNGDRTTPGDYTGDGKADVSFFRPNTGEWFIIRSEDFSFFSFPWGTANDIPAPGDYDGDGKFDATVFRPSSTTWFSNTTSSGVQIVGFGLNGDIPVPSVFSRE